MKRYSIVLSFILTLIIAAPASAYSIDNLFSYGDGGYTSAYAGAIIEDFDPRAEVSTGWTFTGNYAIRQGSDTPSAAPWWDNEGEGSGARDVTYFLTVPLSMSVTPLSVTIGFKGSAYQYFGLWWGSMDTYNTLEFLNAAGEAIATFTGADFSSGSGAQDLSETNKYVNFYDMPAFSAVRLTSTNYAFEADNIAVGDVVVPEPLTALLLGCGLIGLLGLRRKMK